MLAGTTRLALAACVLAACGGSPPEVEPPPRVVISARGPGSAGAPPQQESVASVAPAEPAVARSNVAAVPDAVVWSPADLASAKPAREAAPPAAPSAGIQASLELLRDVPDGALDDATKAKLQKILVPQPDPRQSVDLEIALLHKGIYLRDAPLYDGAWRNAQHPQGWDAERQRAIARQWDRPYEMLVDGGKAVAFYRDAPELPPTFLRRKNMGWMIDASRTAAMVVYDESRRTWYLLDQGSPYLSLIMRALPLRQLTLEDGRGAWELDPGVSLDPGASQQ